MAMTEDAASVLEQFIQDANLPAEIVHYLEEIQAKDRIVQECRNAITSRDNSIQKFNKLNGTGQANPKEEAYAKSILASFDHAQAVQEEKVALSEKAASVLDRQIKKLDFKIRDLQNEGAISIDPQLPSLLNTSTLTSRPPPLSTSTTASSTPLHPLSGNAGPSTTIANHPIARLAQKPPQTHRHPSPLSTTVLPPITTNTPLLSSINTNIAQPPPQSSLLNPRVTPRSPSTDPSKRRRLNPHHLAIPPTSSSLRQSSLGPGTPKAALPLAVASRGSSAGPRPASKKPSRPPHHQRIGYLNPSSSASLATSNKKLSRRRVGKKGSTLGNAGTPAGHPKPSHSDTGEESALSEADGQEGESDAEMEDGEGEGDDRKYCTCRNVSYGNMVACDNEECPYEWFHWSCVGMKEEPVGKWYCEECKRKM